MESKNSKDYSISKPVKHPDFKTISDLKFEESLPQKTETTLIALKKALPRTSFENLTTKEALSIEKYIMVIHKMDKKEIWEIIKPYIGAIFNIDLYGNVHDRMKYVEKSSENPDYVPTKETLEELARRIVQGKDDLFKRNIDMGIRRFSSEKDSIVYLLIMLKIQKEIYPTRQQKIQKAYFPKFQNLIQKHSELIIKLKIAGKTGDDFFGSEYEDVKKQLRILRGMAYRSMSGKSFTPKQQSLMLNILDEYKETMDFIFMSDEDDRIIFEQDIIRPKEDINLASLEIYNYFDDSPTSRTSTRITVNEAYPSACEIVNSICVNAPTRGAIVSLYKSIIMYENLKNFIGNYFNTNVERRRDIRGKINEYDGAKKEIVQQFFDVLDKYLS